MWCLVIGSFCRSRKKIVGNNKNGKNRYKKILKRPIPSRLRPEADCSLDTCSIFHAFICMFLFSSLLLFLPSRTHRTTTENYYDRDCVRALLTKFQCAK